MNFKKEPYNFGLSNFLITFRKDQYVFFSKYTVVISVLLHFLILYKEGHNEEISAIIPKITISIVALMILIIVKRIIIVRNILAEGFIVKGEIIKATDGNIGFQNKAVYKTNRGNIGYSYYYNGKKYFKNEETSGHINESNLKNGDEIDIFIDKNKPNRSYIKECFVKE